MIRKYVPYLILLLIVAAFLSVEIEAIWPEVFQSRPMESEEKIDVDTEIIETREVYEEAEEEIEISKETSERRQWLRDTIRPIQWRPVTVGVELGIAEGKFECNIDDSKIWILRADPAYTEFVMISGKQTHRTNTAKQWAEQQHLVATINAGMYQGDHATNLGFMKIGDYLNQSRISNDKLFLAFGPDSSDLPPAMMIDKECHDWESLIDHYTYVTQSIRMINCAGSNRWSRQEKYWSVASAAVDREGRLLLIHSRTPWAMHDFIDMIRNLNLEVMGLIYLEGGPEASLYIDGVDQDYSRIGSYETGFFESNDNERFWPIPNVIGIRLK